MTWQQLHLAGRVKTYQTSKQELDDLRTVVECDLQDAAIEAVSDDRRFAIAYNAVLQTSKMVIACAGFRVTGIGHHQTTFEAIELAMGKQATRYAAFFETCRRKRNNVDYDMSGIATRIEFDELIEEATMFVALAEAWIEQTHPTFKK